MDIPIGELTKEAVGLSAAHRKVIAAAGVPAADGNLDVASPATARASERHRPKAAVGSKWNADPVGLSRCDSGGACGCRGSKPEAGGGESGRPQRSGSRYKRARLASSPRCQELPEFAGYPARLLIGNCAATAKLSPAAATGQPSARPASRLRFGDGGAVVAPGMSWGCRGVVPAGGGQPVRIGQRHDDRLGQIPGPGVARRRELRESGRDDQI